MENQFDMMGNCEFPGMDGDVYGQTDGMISYNLDNDFLGSPFSSGFDSEHPMPTFQELRNAGFSSHVANSILNTYANHSYSQKELFHCLYESDDPVSAYNEMVGAKALKWMDETDKLIQEIEADLCFGAVDANNLEFIRDEIQTNFIESNFDNCDVMEVLEYTADVDDSGQYNLISDDDEETYGSCDCRSECKYNTGHTYKYADYGYSD